MVPTMIRWELASLGLKTLQMHSAPMPVPKPGEVLIEVSAVSLNYRDGEVAENGMGVALTFPFTPASDMAGRVVALGDGVKRFNVGDAVVSTCIAGWIDGAPLSWAEAPTLGGPLPGMLSEYVVLFADWCVKAPISLTAVEACTLPVAALTPWMALVELGHLHAGQTVVVQGTGGVSLFAIQLAAANGADVIVTSSSDDKIEHTISLGAKHGINRHKVPDWQTSVRSLTGGRGADHILEMAGGNNVRQSLEAVASGGRISVIGLLQSNEFCLPILPLLGSRASIVGISVGPRRALEDLIQAIDQHQIKPVIDAIYSFMKVPDAFEHLRRGAFGKIVIQVRDA
jgi:NADPH:quinone reductase-like Zn-dependent oxidoreductase